MKRIFGMLPHKLLNHPDPAVRYFAQQILLEADLDEHEMSQARWDLLNSPLIQSLCAFDLSLHPYQKWNGAHWRLVELGYPYVNPALEEPRAQVYAWLSSERHISSIRMLEGRSRRCASQEANAVFASVRLNLADEQTENLLIKLLSWQWPDGAGTATSARKPRIPLSGRPGRPCARC